MFFSMIISAMATTAFATQYESHVEVFSNENCKGHMLDRTLKTGDCHAMKLDLLVPDISQLNYGHVKHSGDNPNEIYFFESKQKCEEYGDSFNKDVEVVFIRAPGRSNCYSVVRGGNAKSIRFTNPKATVVTPPNPAEKPAEKPVEKTEKPAEAAKPAAEKPAAEKPAVEKPKGEGDITAKGSDSTHLVVSSLVVMAATAASALF
jgi:hypothetical protein